jgi:peptide/nickel transport system substrate-binding protein
VRNNRAHFHRGRMLLCPLFCLVVLLGNAALASPQQGSTKEELLVLPGEVGRAGGRLVMSLRGEPKTLNPLIAADSRSREVISVMQADLVHINRATQLTEPGLAKSWKVSPNGLEYTIVLRQGIKFSDGQPLDADDVLFTFRVYLDENVHATQRDLLIIGGKPIALRKADAHTIVFQLAKTYGVGERLFDGMVILPRHLLEKPYKEGKLGQIGSLAAAADQWATAGPGAQSLLLEGGRKGESAALRG